MASLDTLSVQAEESPLISRTSARKRGTVCCSCAGVNTAALTRIKPVADVLKDVALDNKDMAMHENKLDRQLTVVDLIGYGVGCTVGAGIYSMLSEGSQIAGPGILISFAIGGFSCMMTGMAYSEFAARVPVAGSAYTFAYTSFGEFLAWMIGWDLTLEYAISAAAIARSWGSYFMKFLQDWFGYAPVWLHHVKIGEADCSPIAAAFVLACSGMLLLGAKISSRFNVAVTILNICVLLFVCIYGSFFVDPGNWTAVNDSFVPYGFPSIFIGAGAIFFSFLGFDMVSSLAEEVKKPQRDIPIGIIGSLTVSVLVYVGVTIVITGMIPFTAMKGDSAPLALAFTLHDQVWASRIISFGSLFGLTTATFTCLLGQPRIFYRMSRDGLLYEFFSHVSPRFKVPVAGTIITGVVTALICFFTTLEILADAINIGTLLAFSIVDAGVVTFRYTTKERPYRAVVCLLIFMSSTFVACLAGTYGWGAYIYGPFAAVGFVAFLPLCFMEVNEENLPSTFRCPLVPYVPCLGIAVNLFMMAGLRPESWARLVIWFFIGLVIYFTYGVHNSKMRPENIEAADKERRSVEDAVTR